MRVRELFTHGEGISTPRARHKRRQPLIDCAKHDFKTMYFPFFIFFMYFSFLFFFYFLGLTRVLPLLLLSSGTMRNSDLRSSLSMNVCFVTLILCFLID